MKLILMVFLLAYAYASASAITNHYGTDNFFLPDTLIEPGKENPDESVLDTLPLETPQPPDTVETDEDKTLQQDISNVIEYAAAELTPTEGNQGKGKLLFTRIDNGIHITGKISGLTPGLHGIHIHEFGDCNSPDASSAGGHFNPDNMSHGAPEDAQRHTGDLGNLDVDENGEVRIDITDTKLSFEGIHSIIGKAVVVHAGRDDLKSQPAGDSGARILCGMIENTNKEVIK